MLNNIIGILAIPIMILNFGGGVIGGIWLAFRGEWKLIVVGLLLLVVSHWILAILMIPGMMFSGAAIKFGEKSKLLLMVFGLLSQVYTNLLIVASCAVAYVICASFYKGYMGVGFVPYLLWAWGMALGPWQYFASKEPDNEFSSMALFSASLFYMMFLLSIFISPQLPLIISGLFIVFQLLVLPIFFVYIGHKMEGQGAF